MREQTKCNHEGIGKARASLPQLDIRPRIAERIGYQRNVRRQGQRRRRAMADQIAKIARAQTGIAQRIRYGARCHVGIARARVRLLATVDKRTAEMARFNAQSPGDRIHRAP